MKFQIQDQQVHMQRSGRSDLFGTRVSARERDGKALAVRHGKRMATGPPNRQCGSVHLHGRYEYSRHRVSIQRHEHR